MFWHTFFIWNDLSFVSLPHQLLYPPVPLLIHLLCLSVSQQVPTRNSQLFCSLSALMSSWTQLSANDYSGEKFTSQSVCYAQRLAQEEKHVTCPIPQLQINCLTCIHPHKSILSPQNQFPFQHSPRKMYFPWLTGTYYSIPTVFFLFKYCGNASSIFLILELSPGELSAISFLVVIPIFAAFHSMHCTLSWLSISYITHEEFQYSALYHFTLQVANTPLHTQW